MKWISVDERLPADDKLKVIRYAEVWRGVKRHLGIQLSRYYTPSNMRTKLWCFEFASTQPTRVTHWMPLPPPPEAEND